MKEKVLLLYACLLPFILFVGSSAEAVESKSQTDIGITFFSENSENTEGSSPSPSDNQVIHSTPNVRGNSTDRLPSTGELITTMIWILCGCSVLLFIMGVVTLNKIMLKESWG